MRKITFSSLALLLMLSCSQSPEEKASALIQESLESMFWHPETYEPMRMGIDSAFAPLDDPVFYEKSLEICKLAVENIEYIEKAQDAENRMNSKDKAGYAQAKQDFDYFNEKVNMLNDRIQDYGKELTAMVGPAYSFIGYKVAHRFEILDNMGNKVQKNMVYIMDEKLTKILAEYDTESKEYIMVQSMYQMWEEETISMISNI